MSQDDYAKTMRAVKQRQPQQVTQTLAQPTAAPPPNAGTTSAAGVPPAPNTPPTATPNAPPSTSGFSVSGKEMGAMTPAQYNQWLKKVRR